MTAEEPIKAVGVFHSIWKSARRDDEHLHFAQVAKAVRELLKGRKNSSAPLEVGVEMKVDGTDPEDNFLRSKASSIPHANMTAPEFWNRFYRLCMKKGIVVHSLTDPVGSALEVIHEWVRIARALEDLVEEGTGSSKRTLLVWADETDARPPARALAHIKNDIKRLKHFQLDELEHALIVMRSNRLLKVAAKKGLHNLVVGQGHVEDWQEAGQDLKVINLNPPTIPNAALRLQHFLKYQALVEKLEHYLENSMGKG